MMEDYSECEILIVEDNPQDAELMVRALKKNRLANRLVLLEDGAAALDFLFCRGDFSSKNSNVKPKVIFLDLKLPKVNGLEVLEAIKNNEMTKTIPVVIVTSSREDPDIQTAYRLGANSYVTKPVDFEAFVKTIHHLDLYWLVVNVS